MVSPGGLVAFGLSDLDDGTMSNEAEPSNRENTTTRSVARAPLGGWERTPRSEF